MSWWVYLEQKGTNLSVENFAEGGTYAIGGQEMPELNITYNYGKFYGLIDSEKGLLWIHRKKAKTCIPRLEKAIKELEQREVLTIGIPQREMLDMLYPFCSNGQSNIQMPDLELVKVIL